MDDLEIVCTLSYAEIVVPSFSGQSFFSANISGLSLSIYLSLRTTTTNSLVFSVPGSSGSHIILRVTDTGSLALDYIMELGSTINVTAPLYFVADNNWHYVNVTVTDSLNLSIDGRISYSNPLPIHINPFVHNSILYVGGVGNLLIPFEILNFDGCIDRLSINGQPFLNDFVDGVGISECAMGACSSTVCLDNGVCVEEAGSAQGYQCQCNLGYRGVACDEGKSVCV